MSKSFAALLAGAAAGAIGGAALAPWYGPLLRAFVDPGSAAAAASGATPEASTSQDRRVLYYRNPMGLPDSSPVPKKDSMGMDYIPVYADEATDQPGTIRVAPAKVQRAGVRTALVARRELTHVIRATGTVEADEARLADVTVRFDGFVEELFVSRTGARVRAGQPLARVWIESREILQKQADFLQALRAGGGRSGEVERATRNLRLFGIPDEAIDGLRRSGEPVRSMVITAPLGGTVLQKPAVAGMRFAAGDTLLKMADLSTVWVVAQVAERDLAPLRIGQAAEDLFAAFPNQPVIGKVAFVYPDLAMSTRTGRIRIELSNADGRLKLGLFADVRIESRPATAPVLAIPEAAVMDSGSRRVAFVAKDAGLFEPRALTTGARGDGYVEVLSGLEEGERIVVSGNFLIDAESNLRAALQAFVAPGAEP